MWGPQQLLTPPSLLQTSSWPHLPGPDQDVQLLPTSCGLQDASLCSSVTWINDCLQLCLSVWEKGIRRAGVQGGPRWTRSHPLALDDPKTPGDIRAQLRQHLGPRLILSLQTSLRPGPSVWGPSRSRQRDKLDLWDIYWGENFRRGGWYRSEANKGQEEGQSVRVRMNLKV